MESNGYNKSCSTNDKQPHKKFVLKTSGEQEKKILKCQALKFNLN